MSKPIFTLAVDSPVGRLALESDDNSLTRVWLPGAEQPTPVNSLDTPRILRIAASQLDEYFAHERTEFNLPMSLEGTSFQRAVWAALCAIPYGETMSYGALARRIDCPKGFRAVGQANARNPLPIIVPCHRVVASNGLGGFAGGLPMKQALLAVERSTLAMVRSETNFAANEEVAPTSDNTHVTL